MSTAPFWKDFGGLFDGMDVTPPCWFLGAWPLHHTSKGIIPAKAMGTFSTYISTLTQSLKSIHQEMGELE
ncbi:hypothetical protein PISMIDRAFT_20038 [Pisolithus microcarpus 441]|uniref:Uncharacterized protein n=1 Tax=Pisolithus microcarpus 441 TaxID=765257 RepID=A0A0C9YKF9_9AGAM|nr:hypothetical protein PISMIDRAFT_20038 [Pisolithus microcarpus 441]